MGFHQKQTQLEKVKGQIMICSWKASETKSSNKGSLNPDLFKLNKTKTFKNNYRVYILFFFILRLMSDKKF